MEEKKDTAGQIVNLEIKKKQKQTSQTCQSRQP